MNVMDRLNAALAKPMTHVVITAFSDGTEKRHEVRDIRAAQMWTISEDRKIGKSFISRETGVKSKVVSVRTEAL